MICFRFLKCLAQLSVHDFYKHFKSRLVHWFTITKFSFIYLLSLHYHSLLIPLTRVKDPEVRLFFSAEHCHKGLHSFQTRLLQHLLENEPCTTWQVLTPVTLGMIFIVRLLIPLTDLNALSLISSTELKA